MTMKDKGFFLTQKGKRRGQADDAIDADQLEEMVAGVAQTSQSTLLLKKKKEMREVRLSSQSISDASCSSSIYSSCLQANAWTELHQLSIYVAHLQPHLRSVV